MNRTSRSAIKHKAGHAAMPDHAAPAEDLDYEAIEQAVMQTARGRWFLAEYLRRHQNDETRRLAAALRRLAGAQERLLAPARESSALEGIRLLLARAADDLAPPGEERTLPEAAAGRLRELLHAASCNPERAMIACDVLSDCFTQLAHLLGEPSPLSQPELHETLEEPTPAPVAAPCPEGAAHTTSPFSTPRADAEGATDKDETPATRIVIRRRPRSGEVNIPLPDKDTKTTAPANPDSASASGQEQVSTPQRRVRIQINRQA